MSTAAGSVTVSPLQVALQMPPDQAAPVAAGGDFTAVLAAACVAEPDTGMPEGMQSAAALAWLAGLATADLPLQSLPGSEVPALPAAPTATAADLEDTDEAAPVAVLSILQGMLAPVVSVPRESVEEPVAATVTSEVEARAVDPRVVRPDAASNVISMAAAVEPEDSRAESEVAAGSTVAGVIPAADVTVTDASAIAFQSTAPVVVPLALMRSVKADVKSDGAAAVQSDASIATTGNATGISSENPASKDTSRDSNKGERLVAALVDRASMQSGSTGVQTDVDRNAVTGTNLYTSTREVVANASGQVSSRPEVVHSTVGSPRWANELGSRLAMMSVRGQQEGSLTLTPEHLGPLEVRISMNQDTTNVWFGAQHADTRAALADAMPRLREMFSQAGLSLGHADVSQQTPGQDSRRGESSGTRLSSDADPAEALPAAQVRVSRGLLDTWA